MRTKLAGTLMGAAALLACGFADVATAVAQSPHRPPRVLILFALAPESPTSAVFIERLRATLRAELARPVDVFEEYLDLDRFPGPQAPQQFLRFYRDKYQGQTPDLVLAVGTTAFQFAVDHLRPIMPGVPIVFGMTYAHRVRVAELPENVTGRTVSVTLGRSLVMARRLQPQADRVVLIAGSSPIDSAAMFEALADAKAHGQKIRVDRWQGFPYDSLLRELRSLTPRTIVYFAHFRRDGRGRNRVPMEVLPEIARESGAPVYAFTDPQMGIGLLGGAIWRQADEAVLTGRLAARVLLREAGAPLPAVESASTPFIADSRVLRRFGLDQRRLPPGTQVLFRTPTFWERHGEVILSALLVIAVESVLIGLLLLERRRRIRAQLAMADQARYEQTIAELMADSASFAPQAAPGALQDALARIGRYADADQVVLVRYSPTASQPRTCLRWARDRRATTEATGGSEAAAPIGPLLEFPLVVAEKTVGRLILRRAKGAKAWSPDLIERLAAAAGVLAVAVTRSLEVQRAEEAGRQVAHIGRVAMIGELASTISHELRQPLAAILLNAETGKQMLARKWDAVELAHVLDDIIADDKRASGVIEHIRSLLRKESQSVTTVDINAICRDAADLLKHDAMKRGVRLEVSLDSRLRPVAGHPIELQQVVLNLVLNAFDAVMSAGERHVTLATTADDGRVHIVVRDSGSGLSADARNRVFESFFTTKAHGLGMGLAIVRSIVEGHRGHIEVESGDHDGAGDGGDGGGSGGAIFRVTLPAIHAPHPSAAKESEFAGAL